MKKQILLLFALLLCAAGSAAAQGREFPLRKKYVNFGYSTPQLRLSDAPALKSEYGASFTVGRTYFLHRKPVAGMLRFGLDATWFDVSYANYKVAAGDTEGDALNLHQAELGMQVGPSITVNPVSRLNIHGYFRYAPSFSALYDGDMFLGNYATVFVGGGAVYFGKVGLGVEARFGSCRYKQLTGGGQDDESADGVSPKITFSGMRAYITLRF